MPKEKTTTRKTKTRGVEKKKKGKSDLVADSRALLMSASDPNAPKRGLSAYMFFANEQRESVREQNPGISFGKSCFCSLSPMSTSLTIDTGQVGKVLGERWKALSDEERRPYEEKAQADKKRYEDEKASYNVGS